MKVGKVDRCLRLKSALGAGFRLETSPLLHLATKKDIGREYSSWLLNSM